MRVTDYNKVPKNLPPYGIAKHGGHVYLGRFSRNGSGDCVDGLRLERESLGLLAGHIIDTSAALDILDALAKPEEGPFQLPKYALEVMYPLTKQEYETLRRRLNVHQ